MVYTVWHTLIHEDMIPVWFDTCACSEEVGEALAHAPRARLKMARVPPATKAASLRYLNASHRQEISQEEETARLISLWRNLEGVGIEPDVAVTLLRMTSAVLSLGQV